MVEGDAAFSRSDLAMHIQATWAMEVRDAVKVRVFGGPTVFRIDQDLVRSIDFVDTFPFLTATFVSAPTETQSASTLGFHAGAGVRLRL